MEEIKIINPEDIGDPVEVDIVLPMLTPAAPLWSVDRALSVRQPWAWLIVNGYKDLENRSWYPGKARLGWNMIHAGKSVDKNGYDWIRRNFPAIELPAIEDLKTGGIVGLAFFCAFKEVDQDRPPTNSWYMGTKFAWLISSAQPIDFIPCKGQLSFFKPKLQRKL